MAPEGSSPELLSRAEQFLFREARLMDAHALKEWLELWTEELLYWVPSNRSACAAFVFRKCPGTHGNRSVGASDHAERPL